MLLGGVQKSRRADGKCMQIIPYTSCSNARSPTVWHRVRGTISSWVADDRRRCQELLSVAQCRSLVRYTGVVWLWQQKTSTASLNVVGAPRHSSNAGPGAME